MPVFNASSVDPDQMALSVASDLVLYCLPITLLWGFLTKFPQSEVFFLKLVQAEI